MRGPDGKGSEDIDEADDELADHGGQKGGRREGEKTRGKGPGPSEKGKLKREGTEVGRERTGARRWLDAGHPGALVGVVVHWACCNTWKTALPNLNKQAPGPCSLNLALTDRTSVDSAEWDLPLQHRPEQLFEHAGFNISKQWQPTAG